MVLPISVDSVPTLKEFKAKERISVDLLSDFKRDVSRRYGTLLEEQVLLQPGLRADRPERHGAVAFMEDTPGTRRENAELLAAAARAPVARTGREAPRPCGGWRW